MRRSILSFLAPGFGFFALSLLFLATTLFYRALGLPSPAEVSAFFSRFYSDYGLAALFVAAFLEGLFVVNLYVPGSLVIVLAILAAKRAGDGPLNLVAIVFLAFISAATLNFYLGRLGFYKAFTRLGGSRLVEVAERRASKGMIKAILFSAMHPNLHAPLAVFLGTARYRFFSFAIYSTAAFGFWISVGVAIAWLAVEKVNPEEKDSMFVAAGALALVGLLVCLFTHWRSARSRAAASQEGPAK